MTEKLKDLMTHAVEVEFDAIDLAAIMDAGERKARSRRTALVGGCAALAVVAAGAAWALGAGSEAKDRTPLVDRPSAEVVWAAGDQIVTPTSTTDVGHPVRAFVRTRAGFVTVDDQGGVWSVVGGRATSIGRTADARVVADGETSVAAWLEPAPGGLRWTAYDQDRGERMLSRPVGAASGEAQVVALDDHNLYVRVGGYQALDLSGGDPRPVKAPSPDAQLLAVENDVRVWLAGESYVIEHLGRPPVEIPQVHGDLAVLSPDGRRVSFDADDLRVFDARTGEQDPVDVGGRPFATGFEWLSNDDIAVISSEDGKVAQLLTCSVPDRTCTTVARDLGTFDEMESGAVVLPFGAPLDD